MELPPIVGLFSLPVETNIPDVNPEKQEDSIIVNIN